MTDASAWPVVIVESPYAGDFQANHAYAIRACKDCLKREEIPYASHIFFPQFLDDLDPDQRKLGLTAGYAFWKAAVKIVFYGDLGMSPGMTRAMQRASLYGFPTETRYLDGGNNAKEHCCEEAAMGMGNAYFPCNKPATKIVQPKSSTEGSYRMCDACADHSVRNRGMILIGPYTAQEPST